MLTALRRWWMTPPRSGIQVIICPWEYRHLRASARAHIGVGVVLLALALAVLTFGGSDWRAYAWTLVFVVFSAGHLALGYWELTLADAVEGG